MGACLPYRVSGSPTPRIGTMILVAYCPTGPRQPTPARTNCARMYFPSKMADDECATHEIVALVRPGFRGRTQVGVRLGVWAEPANSHFDLFFR